jgi:hypothetical protein
MLCYSWIEGNILLLKHGLGNNLISTISSSLEVYVIHILISNHSPRIPEPTNWLFMAEKVFSWAILRVLKPSSKYILWTLGI